MTALPLLAFDTSAAHCAAALLCPGAAPAIRVDAMARGQAEHLMPMLEAMLTGAGIGWRDLAAIGVGIGPGNFTGIRIAVSAARGLALALKVPAVGVSGFDVAEAAFPGAGAALIPAPGGMAYLRRPLAPPALIPEAEAAALPGPVARLDALTAERQIVLMAGIAQGRAGQPGLPRPAPLYVRPADAAPPSDPPPVILP